MNKTKSHAQSTKLSRAVWKAGNLLYPLPAVLVTVGDLKGVKNVFTVAWAGTVSSKPPMCSISVRPERYSYGLIKKHRSFVINLTTKKLLRAVDWCGVKSGKDFDKFKEMKLTPLPAQKVSAPLIAESPINIECQVKDILSYGSHDMFTAEVVAVNVNPEFFADEKSAAFSLIRSAPICYVHGHYYELGRHLGFFGFSVQKKGKKTKK
jgi:flavin reductase (DIM6/NTAB) family NADH-FMN oxidoreductase RutF